MPRQYSMIALLSDRRVPCRSGDGSARTELLLPVLLHRRAWQRHEPQAVNVIHASALFRDPSGCPHRPRRCASMFHLPHSATATGTSPRESDMFQLLRFLAASASCPWEEPRNQTACSEIADRPVLPDFSGAVCLYQRGCCPVIECSSRDPGILQRIPCLPS